MSRFGHEDLWRTHAACTGADVSRWYPVNGHDGLEARTICAGCPVRDDCLQAHVREEHGLFGGTSERLRRKLRRLWAHSPHPGQFTVHGCTCPLCTELVKHRVRMIALTEQALAEAQAERDAAATVFAPERMNTNGGGAQHGKASTYARGCDAGLDGRPCGPCTDAMRVSRARNRALRLVQQCEQGSAA